jgi:Kae1-associated kinase Bud32
MMHEVKKIGIQAPILYAWNENDCTLVIEFINGPRLKNVLLKKGLSPFRKKRLCTDFGKIIAMMHANGFIHGDLTTSNVLVRKKGAQDELVLIDFGLSTHSKKLEDVAVDLVNLKKTFTATHADYEEGWTIIQDAYRAHGGKAAALAQMEKVEQRIRYA